MLGNLCFSEQIFYRRRSLGTPDKRVVSLLCNLVEVKPSAYSHSRPTDPPVCYLHQLRQAWSTLWKLLLFTQNVMLAFVRIASFLNAKYKQPLFSARVERKDPDERGGRTSSLSQVPSHIHMFALAYDEIIGLISLTAVGSCKNIMFGLYLRSSSQNCPSSHIVKWYHDQSALQ